MAAPPGWLRQEGTNWSMPEKLAVMADSPPDCERLGLSPTTIAPL